MPASSRAARPSRDSSRTASIAASSRGSAGRSLSPIKGARWTEVPVSSRCIQSSRMGERRQQAADGNQRLMERGESGRGCRRSRLPYMRGLLRRTYHFETSSSTKAMMARAAVVASNFSNASSDGRSTRDRRARIHRSIGGRSAIGGSAFDGLQPKWRRARSCRCRCS